MRESGPTDSSRPTPKGSNGGLEISLGRGLGEDLDRGDRPRARRLRPGHRQRAGLVSSRAVHDVRPPPTATAADPRGAAITTASLRGAQGGFHGKAGAAVVYKTGSAF